MREDVIYAMLRTIKGFSRLFYRFDIKWISDPPLDPWKNLRLVIFLNHTSLYEPLFVGGFPNAFIKRIAYKGAMPVADKAIKKPVMGFFFRMVAKNVVSITRKKDRTWKNVLAAMSPDTMMIIMPEGRMMRADGLDKKGNPMTVRGGIADIIQAIPKGNMLITYSAGLHHVQVPGQRRLPNLFRKLSMGLEIVDIEKYRQTLLEKHGASGFKKAVVHDLETRRNKNCYGYRDPSCCYAAAEA